MTSLPFDTSKYTIPVRTLPADEINHVVMSEQGIFALSYGSFLSWQIYCIMKNIPYRIYERFDAGGGGGYIFQLISMDHLRSLLAHFLVPFTHFSKLNTFSSGWAFILDSTNCDATFTIPTTKRYPKKDVDLLRYCRPPEYKKISFNTESSIKISGVIMERHPYYYKVMMTSPFMGWPVVSNITGPGKQAYNFLGDFGVKSMIRELTTNYQKIKIIDKSIERIAKVYRRVKEEIAVVNRLPDDVAEHRDSIISSVKTDFYNNILFSSSITGLTATISDTDPINHILQTYLDRSEKIYVLANNSG